MGILKRRALFGASLLAVLVVAAITAASAFAAPDPRITPVYTDPVNSGDYHDAAVQLAVSIATDPSQLTDAQFVTTTPPQPSVAPEGYPDPDTWPHIGEDDGPLAIGNNSGGLLAGFPTNGTTYGILTTGDPWFADQANQSDGATRENNGAPVRGDTDEDVSILEMDMNVPSGVNCLSLDYRFLSEEFPEFVGSPYNDAFIAEVDSSTWSTAGSTISAPNDFATKTGTSGVSINGVGPVAVSATESSDTTYDAATGLVTTHTPITPGAHKVFLSIFDQSDEQLDSAAFVDNLHFVNEDPSVCKPPEVAQAPPPPPPAQPGPPAPPSNNITGSSIKFKNGATILSVTVPGPGTVAASQATSAAASRLADAAKKKKHKKHKKPVLIKKTKVTATGPGIVKLTIRPTAAGRKVLKKRGKFTVKTAITYTPTGGTAKTTFRKVTVKVIKKHHKKHKKH